MPFRFRKSIKIAPGISMNLSKRGITSINIGKTNIGLNGIFHTFSLPGTGLSYRAQISGGSVLDALKEGAEHAAPATGDIQLALQDDGSIAFKDKAGKPLSGDAVAAEKKQNREMILAWLADQQAKWNAGADAVLNIHLTTPAPDGDVVISPDADGDKAKEAEQALRSNPEVMSAALNSAFANINWPRETNISFEISDDASEVWLDVDLPEVEDMPDQEPEVDASELRLEISERPQKSIQADYLRHIHAIGFRLIGEVFAHLPGISMVVFSGYSQRLNPRTGNTDDEYLYSVRVPRAKWQKINFSNLNKVDVVACFEEFDLRRKATKQGTITAIEPFEK